MKRVTSGICAENEVEEAVQQIWLIDIKPNAVCAVSEIVA